MASAFSLMASASASPFMRMASASFWAAYRAASASACRRNLSASAAAMDLANYDLSSIHHMTTAGEALNPEVYRQFEKATGLKIMEGFGQTETTLTIGNLYGTTPKIGSMGKANPQYDVDIVDPDGNPVANGEVGEIVIHTDKDVPCGLYREYYLDEEKTKEAWHDGMYHTGDTAWRDEDGYFWDIPVFPETGRIRKDRNDYALGIPDAGFQLEPCRV